MNLTSKLVSSPVPFKLGKKKRFDYRGGNYLILHPLTLKEWTFLDEVIGSDPELNTEAAFYAIWLSVRKEDPDLKRSDFTWTFSQHPDLIAEMMEVITRISMPESILKTEETVSDIKDELAVFRVMAEYYGWDANRVSSMTPAQIAFYLENLAKGKGSRGGVKVHSLDEARRVLRLIKEKKRGDD